MEEWRLYRKRGTKRIKKETIFIPKLCSSIRRKRKQLWTAKGSPEFYETIQGEATSLLITDTLKSVEEQQKG